MRWRFFVLICWLSEFNDQGRGYHGPKILARDRGDAVRWAVRTLARAFGDAGRPDWRGPGWLRRPGWRPARWSEPRWFAGAPPRRAFPGTREPGFWRPRFFREERRNNWQPPPVQSPGNWRFAPTPRRGPPVALIKIPRWHRQAWRKERRPCGSNPQGPLRGGPERSSDDPRLSKTTQRQGQVGRQREEGKKAAHRRHGGQRRPRKNLGTALPHRCMESGVLLGGEKKETPRSSSRRAARKSR